MLQNIYKKLGRILYWVVWPVSWVYLRGSHRTRLLLLCKDEVLVIDNWLGAGKWNLPGGGLHKNEDPKAGVIREVQEETGITLVAESVRLLATEPYSIHGFRYTCHYFAAAVPQKPAIRLQPLEVINVSWAKRAEITSKHFGPDVCRALDLLASKGRI